MAEPSYTMYADEPLYKRIPWWGWVLGLGLIVAVLSARKRGRQDYEDYLR